MSARRGSVPANPFAVSKNCLLVPYVVSVGDHSKCGSPEISALQTLAENVFGPRSHSRSANMIDFFLSMPILCYRFELIESVHHPQLCPGQPAGAREGGLGADSQLRQRRYRQITTTLVDHVRHAWRLERMIVLHDCLQYVELEAASEIARAMALVNTVPVGEATTPAVANHLRRAQFGVELQRAREEMRNGLPPALPELWALWLSLEERGDSPPLKAVLKVIVSVHEGNSQAGTMNLIATSTDLARIDVTEAEMRGRLTNWKEDAWLDQTKPTRPASYQRYLDGKVMYPAPSAASQTRVLQRFELEETHAPVAVSQRSAAQSRGGGDADTRIVVDTSGATARPMADVRLAALPSSDEEPAFQRRKRGNRAGAQVQQARLRKVMGVVDALREQLAAVEQKVGQQQAVPPVVPPPRPLGTQATLGGVVGSMPELEDLFEDAPVETVRGRSRDIRAKDPSPDEQPRGRRGRSKSRHRSQS